MCWWMNFIDEAWCEFFYRENSQWNAWHNQENNSNQPENCTHTKTKSPVLLIFQSFNRYIPLKLCMKKKFMFFYDNIARISPAVRFIITVNIMVEFVQHLNLIFSTLWLVCEYEMSEIYVCLSDFNEFCCRKKVLLCVNITFNMISWLLTCVYINMEI